MSNETAYRCGVISLAGRTNVGKSTLLNRMLGRRVSIVTPKPQTTRYRLSGVKTTATAQLVFVDAPGLHRGARRGLNRVMNRTAKRVMSEGDVVLFVVEARRWTGEDEDVARQLADNQAPVVVAVNKIDRVRPREALLPYLAEVAGRVDNRAIVPVSALTGENVNALEQTLVDLLPPSPALYPEDFVCDRDERFHAAEAVREQLLMRLEQELPYGLQVGIEKFEERDDVLHIGALIWVDREAHKSIVIGRGGSMLKAVGSAARRTLETAFERRIHLQMWVKVRESWADDARELRRFGYEE